MGDGRGVGGCGLPKTKREDRGVLIADGRVLRGTQERRCTIPTVGARNKGCSVV